MYFASTFEIIIPWLYFTDTIQATLVAIAKTDTDCRHPWENSCSVNLTKFDISEVCTQLQLNSEWTPGPFHPVLQQNSGSAPTPLCQRKTNVHRRNGSLLQRFTPFQQSRDHSSNAYNRSTNV